MKLWEKSSIGDIRFNEELKVGEDAFFNIVVSKNIEKFYMLNKELYNYRFNETSVVRKYDEEYANKYLKSMQATKKYIQENYKKNTEILKRLNNYITYHILLIIVNYCFNPQNNMGFIKQIKELIKICSIQEFKEAIKKSSYEGFSLTRKITVFTLKYKLYFLTMIIGKIRQKQFKNQDKIY